MFTLEARENVPVDMLCITAPNAGPAALAIQETARTFKETRLTIPGQRDMDLENAIENCKGFIQIWARKSGDSNVIACLSSPLLGFDASDTRKQQQCGLDILHRIQEFAEVEIPNNYGSYNFTVDFKTELSIQTILEEILKARNTPIETHFPEQKANQQKLNEILHEQLIDPPEGAERPFVDIYEGRTAALRRAFQYNGNYFFHWGYVEEDGEFIGINPDNKKQTLRQLADGSPVPETAELLIDAGKFMAGNCGENRIFVQVAFGIDARCFNDSINAQQVISESTGSYQITLESTSLINTETYTTGGGEIYFGRVYDTEQYCQKCKKSTKENKCECKEKSN